MVFSMVDVILLHTIDDNFSIVVNVVLFGVVFKSVVLQLTISISWVAVERPFTVVVVDEKDFVMYIIFRSKSFVF